MKQAHWGAREERRGQAWGGSCDGNRAQGLSARLPKVLRLLVGSRGGFRFLLGVLSG